MHRQYATLKLQSEKTFESASFHTHLQVNHQIYLSSKTIWPFFYVVWLDTWSYWFAWSVISYAATPQSTMPCDDVMSDLEFVWTAKKGTELILFKHLANLTSGKGVRQCIFNNFVACIPRQNHTAGVSSFALIQLCDVRVAVCLNVLTENVAKDLMPHQFGESDSTNAYQRPCSCGRLVKVTLVCMWLSFSNC